MFWGVRRATGGSPSSWEGGAANTPDAGCDPTTTTSPWGVPKNISHTRDDCTPHTPTRNRSDRITLATLVRPPKQGH